MGIFKAAGASVQGMYQDIWKEFFICPSIPNDIMMMEVSKSCPENNANNGSKDVVTNGSLIVVNDGQNVVVTSQGKIIAVYKDAGEYIFSDPDRPSGIKGALKEFGRRFSFAGAAPPVVHRVYYINTKECTGNPFCTKEPIPVHVKDPKSDLSMDANIHLSGVYSYRISDPEKFFRFALIGGKRTYEFAYVRSQMDAELMKALPPALYRLFGNDVQLHELPGYTEDLCKALQETMSAGWSGQRGINVVSLAISEISSPDQPLVQGLQKDSVFL